MASIHLHKFVERIRGRFGQIVVKQLNGRMFIARSPDQSNRPPPTPGQTLVRQRFTLATAFAQGALRDPDSRLFYEVAAKTRGRGLFSVAAGDFLNPPEVGLVDLGSYRGQTGDKVTILATDDVAVVSVDVVIRAADGSVVEQGPATNAAGPWVYTATTTLPAGQPVTIEVVAKDRPGNTGTKLTPYNMAA